MFEETQQQLLALGHFLKIARKRRGWSQEIVAKRLQVSIDTVKRAEKGDSGIGIGTVLSFFTLYQRIEQFSSVTNPNTDTIGISLSNERLPARVHPKHYDRNF